MFNLIIKGGRIIDGTGNPWFKADVGIVGGKIAKIGRLDDAKALEVLDASGLTVSPGFIDMHSHSDFTLLINGRAESKVRQGVTTEVIGNCGFSAAPLNELMREEMMRTMAILREAKLKLRWSTVKEYLNRLEGQGVAVNVAMLVGHANLRVIAMGFDDRAPSKDELEVMKSALAQAMEDGAFGMSTGLIYAPSCYAKTDELIELSKVVASYGGVYASHVRGEGKTLLSSVKEAIRVAEEAGVSAEISHHKAVGRANWGKVSRTLKIMDEARARGVNVTCDVYPYVAASFGLSAMLPPWAHEGGRRKLLRRLSDPKVRKRLRVEMKRGLRRWPSPLKDAGWDATFIARSRRHPEFEGRSIADVARAERLDPFELMFNLLIEEKTDVSVVRFVIREEDVRKVIQHPLSMIGTDSSALAPYGILGKGKPHPRSYGTFPRVLGKYVREDGIITLENAIRKMTSLPAQKLGLSGRGLIKEGFYADIVVFNPKTVLDKATYDEPHQYPEGIRYVLVNGKVVIDGDEHTGALAGGVLRKRQ